MEAKTFNKENIIELIEEKRWQAEFWLDRVKTKKQIERYKGQMDVCDILKTNINAIWPD